METYHEYFNSPYEKQLDNTETCPKCGNKEMHEYANNNAGKSLYECRSCAGISVIKLPNDEIWQKKPFMTWLYEQEHANRFYGTEQPVKDFAENPVIGSAIYLDFWENPLMEFKQGRRIKVIKVICSGKDENGFYVDLLFKNHDEEKEAFLSLVR